MAAPEKKGVIAPLVRCVNTASKEQLAGAVKKFLPSCPDTVPAHPEQTAAQFTALLCGVLELTLRPSSLQLEEAISFVHGPDPKNNGLACALTKAVQYARGKLRSLTSGAKTSGPLLALLGAIKRKLKTDAPLSPEARLRKRLWQGSPKVLKSDTQGSSESAENSQGSLVPKLPIAVGSVREPMTVQHIMKLMGASHLNVEGEEAENLDPELLSISSEAEVEDLAATASAPVGSSASSNGASRCTFFSDGALLKLIRVTNGMREEAMMEPGPGGFAVGTFSDGTSRVSNIPNLLLEQVKPKPRKQNKKAPLKRPAARGSQKKSKELASDSDIPEEEAEEEAEEAEEAEEEEDEQEEEGEGEQAGEELADEEAQEGAEANPPVPEVDFEHDLRAEVGPGGLLVAVPVAEAKLFRLRLVCATAQTYLLAYDDETKKWPLLCSVTEKATALHHDIFRRICRRLSPAFDSSGPGTFTCHLKFANVAALKEEVLDRRDAWVEACRQAKEKGQRLVIWPLQFPDADVKLLGE